jgi:hypothetical protein
MRQHVLMVMVVSLALLSACGGAAGGAMAPEEPQASTGGTFGPNYASDPMAEPMEEAVMDTAEDSGALGLGRLDFMNRGEDKRLAQRSPGSKPAAGTSPTTMPPTTMPGTPAPPPKVTSDTKPPVSASGSDGPAKMAGPLLIYTATFHMAVFEAGPSIDATYKLAKDLGGYLVRRDQHSIIIRVPVAKYHDALNKVAKLGDVLNREETVEDVTEQFLDMQTRLRNARAMRDRLEQLLAQAKNVKEALAVEKELGRITTDIERMEGRLKRLRELISFSTITVQFKARPSDHVDSTVRLPFPWLDRMGLSNLLSL